MSSALWAIGAIALCGVLLYVAYAIEPHWVAKDGRRFLATAESVDRTGSSLGRRREVRGTLMADGTVLLGKRSLMRTRNAVFRVRGKSPDISRGRQQYVLEALPLDPMDDLTILRIPPKSPLSAPLDTLAANAASAQEP